MNILYLILLIFLGYVLIVALFSILITYILCKLFNWGNIKKVNWLLYIADYFTQSVLKEIK